MSAKKCKRQGCNNTFTPAYSSLQKYCCLNCQIQAKEVRKAVRYNKIKAQSDKRADQLRQYNREVRVWIVGKKCAVYPDLDATECHHIRGRIEEMLLRQEFWLPVSRAGHVFIENNPNKAREKGWIMNRYERNDNNRSPF